MDNNATVSQLMDKIKLKFVHFNASKLQLLLARNRENGAWLKDDEALDSMIEIGVGTSQYLQLHESWQLNDPKLFGWYFGEDVVNVLVVVPEAADGAESTPLTTVDRHPSRLKRWAAINQLVQQKTKDRSKKRQKRDFMSSSSLRWTELEPLLSVANYELQVKSVPDEMVTRALNRLEQLDKLYGDALTGNDAKRKMFIVTVLEAVCMLLKDAKILVQEEVNGKKVHVHAQFDFMLKSGATQIAIVQAEPDNFEQGMAQNVVGLEALADVEGRKQTLGIVTNYLNWVFISDDDECVRIADQSLNESVPSFESMKAILGMIYGMLADNQH